MRYLCMNPPIHKHSKDLKIAKSMLINIEKNNGKLDSDLGLDKDILQRWTYTLTGMATSGKKRRLTSLLKKAKKSCGGINTQ